MPFIPDKQGGGFIPDKEATKDISATDNASLAQKIAAFPLTRFAMGAASPFLGAAEMIPGDIGNYMAWSNKQLKKDIEAGNSSMGTANRYAGGIADFAGNVMSPAFLKLAKALPAAKTTGELIKQGALVGGIGGLTAPTGSEGDTLDRWRNHATGGLIGSVTGGVLTPAMAGVAQVGKNIIYPIVSKTGAERGAAKLIAKGAGKDAQMIAEDLAAGGDIGETAAQIAMKNTNATVVPALQQKFSTYAPTQYEQNRILQEAVRKGEIAKLNAATEPVRQKIFNETGPITADSINSSLESIKTAERNVMNPVLKNIFNRVQRTVSDGANQDGTVSAEALYGLRKHGLDNIILAATKGDQTLAKKMTQSELSDAKKIIDDAITNAGGKGWKQYLQDYSVARGKIEAPLERMDKASELAAKGMAEANRLTNRQEVPVHGVNALNTKMTIANAILRRAQGISGEGINRAGANLMLPIVGEQGLSNPQRLGYLMQDYLNNPYGLMGNAVRYQGGAINPAISGLLQQYQK